ncbi:MAG: alkaline phosphatase family protein [Candidatus Paceibacterota bacterium]
MNTFLIALDGASPDLIDKWIKDGYLENLKKIKKQGLSGELESTFPPLTGPAWSSFHTGVNPGKHGVYNWLDLSDSYKGKVINKSSLKTKTVWKELSDQGEGIGLLSVPVTYPPEEVNGFVIPGFLTPSSAEQKSYPKDLIEELYQAVPEYEFLPEPFTKGKKPKEWEAELKSSVRSRGAAARYLYENHLEENGTMAIHFFATDHVQHYLWDEVTEDWDPRAEVFKEADKQIGKLMEIAPDDSKFIILSDHGFGPLEKTFNVNTWLEEEGYLNLNDNFRAKIKEGLAKIGFTQQNRRNIGEYIYYFVKEVLGINFIDNPIVGLPTNDLMKLLFLSEDSVDWKRTQAYSRSDIGHVRVNLKERENKGAVDGDYETIRREIMKKLANLKVSDAEKKMAEWVKTKEELYSGPYLDDAPDILFNPLEGANCFGKMVGYGAIMFYNSSLFSGKLHPAHHRRDGILMAYGNGIKSQEKNASILDLAPTVLNLNSRKIPYQMDGEVIREISPKEPSYYETKDFYKEPTEVKRNEETREKMESLGYL